MLDSGTNGTHTVNFRILGPLEVDEDGRPIAVGRGKQRSLLALLLLHPNEVVSTERLVDTLWGEQPPETAAKIVQNAVSELRKTLEREGPDGRPKLLLTRGHGYALEIEPAQVDARRFERLLESGRRALSAGEAQAASTTLREALSLWRGEPLADFTYEPFARAEIGRLEELRLACLEGRIEADLALGHHAELVGELEALTAEHPLRERLRGQLMLALYRSGRQAEALEVYRDARRHLVEELGIEASPALQRLERAILTHDPSLELQSAPALSRPKRRLPRKLLLAGIVSVVLAGAAAGLAASFLGQDAGPAARPLLTVKTDSLARIDPATNTLVATIGAGSASIYEGVEVATGSGSIWAGNADRRVVYRIDPRTNSVSQTIPIAGSPFAIAFGAGSLWVVDTDNGAVLRVDAKTGAVTKTVALPSLPGGAIAANDAGVWVNAAGPAANLVRINPYSGAVTPIRVAPSTEEVGIAIGETGLWQVAYGARSVLRIAPREGRVVARVPLPPDFLPTRIAAGEGSVWLIDEAAESVARIDPAHNRITGRPIKVGSSPSAIAVGRAAVWVANGGDGTVSRIDPRRGEVVATIRVGPYPSDVAVGAGGIWVAVHP